MRAILVATSAGFLPAHFAAIARRRLRPYGSTQNVATARHCVMVAHDALGSA
jgi:hypothetical protein